MKPIKKEAADIFQWPSLLSVFEPSSWLVLAIGTVLFFLRLLEQGGGDLPDYEPGEPFPWHQPLHQKWGVQPLSLKS
ncbi:hypothetical protein [Neobacillus sp. FSL H8-0543]|uniref:hypothetical protein n=1 Tax=Neobacillus sp. FSL H8-0543 TaxID=2954672 RepID=UPI0031595FB7